MQDLNANIKFFPHDRLLAKIILPFIPAWVRPNHVTALSLITSPIVFWLFWTRQYGWGLPVFLLVALTDAIDGSLARVRRQITTWGILYDPVADKFLIGGVVLILVIKHINLWLAGFIIGLEFLTVLGALYFKRRQRFFPANLWGKIKMNLQVAGVAVLLVNLIWSAPAMREVSFWVFLSSAVAGIISLIAHGGK